MRYELIGGEYHGTEGEYRGGWIIHCPGERYLMVGQDFGARVCFYEVLSGPWKL